jgi:RNA polymerase sigma-70 factor (ECF subfamily)
MENKKIELDDYQQKLFPYAYNILGSSEDAKDVVQDIIVKHITVETTNIENPFAYMVKAVINRSINLKKRKQKIRENETWLPEPVSTEKADTNINRDEIISYSLLVMLEKLSPRERAVFMLKEGFDYSHKEIAAFIDSSIENSRKILSRAKARLEKEREIPKQTESVNILTYLGDYIQVIKTGDISGLEQLLSKDILLMADGGEKVNVVKELTIGKEATLDLLFYVFKTYLKHLRVRMLEINHQAALLFYKKEKLISCQIFELEDGLIQRIFVVVDPDKLGRI